MTAYYNEVEPYAAQWLRNLIEAGHIPAGEVDKRSIEDVHPDDLVGFDQCHFFAGIGVWAYAMRCAGWPDNQEAWTGSCPCQPFSAAGKGGGIADERHLWPHWHHLISVRKPSRIFGEQVASKDGLGWLDVVQADMEDAGYAIGSVDLCAAGFGAAHIRQRLYWVAHTTDARGQRTKGLRETFGPRQMRQGWAARPEVVRKILEDPEREHDGIVKPLIRPSDDGFATRVGRLRAYGNAIDAYTAQSFIEAAMQVMP